MRHPHKKNVAHDKEGNLSKGAPFPSSFVITVSVSKVDIGQNTFFWDSGTCKVAEAASEMEQNREGIQQ